LFYNDFYLDKLSIFLQVILLIISYIILWAACVAPYGKHQNALHILLVLSLNFLLHRKTLYLAPKKLFHYLASIWYFIHHYNSSLSS